MSEILTTLKVALGPDEDAGTRAIFLIGYLAEVGKLPCSIDKFDEASTIFMKSSGLKQDDFEQVLVSLVQQTITKPGDLDNYRNYVGREVRSYKAAVAAPSTPVVPKTEELVELIIPQNDFTLLSDFEKRTNKVPHISIGSELMRWSMSLASGISIVGRVVNNEIGPRILIQAIQRDGLILSTATPTNNPASVFIVETSATIYKVTLKSDKM